MLNSLIAIAHRSPKAIAHSLVLTTLCVLAGMTNAESKTPKAGELLKTEAIDFVWSGHRIKPYLLTRGNYQFVAYFDANRQMTIAGREGNAPWRYYKVDSWLGWDSHNYVTMELDSEGYIHVMGNMHADPIEYFRSEEPYNVRSIKRHKVMVEPTQEVRMTYPIFMRNKNGELLVKYRHGGSGNGNEIYNIYDVATKSWSRLHANAFVDGQGLMNAYFDGPHLGPDGNFHLVWVWRNSPDSSTNHSLSYARSPDLVNWFDSNGKPLPLPITLKTAEVVAPVPPKGGMINGNVKIGFDHKQRPVVSFHKYDKKGNTQIYVAHKHRKGWKTKQISDWDGFRWDFGGNGSLGRFQVRVHPPEIHDDSSLSVLIRQKDEIMRFILDAKTMKTRSVEPAYLFPPVIETETRAANQTIDNGDMPLEMHTFQGHGEADNYYLSWLSMPGNRDRAHKTITGPSVLQIHTVQP